MSERAPSALFDHPGEFSALSLCCGRGICIRVYEERERDREKDGEYYYVSRECQIR